MKSVYQCAKSTLKIVALDVKVRHRPDKPMIRQIINDTCDGICKDLKLSDYHRGLLEKYSCTLHPED
jgi:putative N-acetylmannosamine-6-phosphate epimerase